MKIHYKSQNLQNSMENFFKKNQKVPLSLTMLINIIFLNIDYYACITMAEAFHDQ